MLKSLGDITNSPGRQSRKRTPHQDVSPVTMGVARPGETPKAPTLSGSPFFAANVTPKNPTLHEVSVEATPAAPLQQACTPIAVIPETMEEEHVAADGDDDSQVNHRTINELFKKILGSPEFQANLNASDATVALKRKIQNLAREFTEAAPQQAERSPTAEVANATPPSRKPDNFDSDTSDLSVDATVYRILEGMISSGDITIKHTASTMARPWRRPRIPNVFGISSSEHQDDVDSGDDCFDSNMVEAPLQKLCGPGPGRTQMDLERSERLHQQLVGAGSAYQSHPGTPHSAAEADTTTDTMHAVRHVLDAMNMAGGNTFNTVATLDNHDSLVLELPSLLRNESAIHCHSEAEDGDEEDSLDRPETSSGSVSEFDDDDDDDDDDANDVSSDHSACDTSNIAVAAWSDDECDTLSIGGRDFSEHDDDDIDDDESAVIVRRLEESALVAKAYELGPSTFRSWFEVYIDTLRSAGLLDESFDLSTDEILFQAQHTYSKDIEPDTPPALTNSVAEATDTDKSLKLPRTQQLLSKLLSQMRSPCPDDSHWSQVPLSPDTSATVTRGDGVQMKENACATVNESNDWSKPPPTPFDRSSSQEARTNCETRGAGAFAEEAPATFSIHQFAVGSQHTVLFLGYKREWMQARVIEVTEGSTPTDFTCLFHFEAEDESMREWIRPNAEVHRIDESQSAEGSHTSKPQPGPSTLAAHTTNDDSQEQSAKKDWLLVDDEGNPVSMDFFRQLSEQSRESQAKRMTSPWVQSATRLVASPRRSSSTFTTMLNCNKVDDERDSGTDNSVDEWQYAVIPSPFQSSSRPVQVTPQKRRSLSDGDDDGDDERELSIVLSAAKRQLPELVAPETPLLTSERFTDTCEVVGDNCVDLSDRLAKVNSRWQWDPQFMSARSIVSSILWVLFAAAMATVVSVDLAGFHNHYMLMRTGLESVGDSLSSVAALLPWDTTMFGRAVPITSAVHLPHGGVTIDGSDINVEVYVKVAPQLKHTGTQHGDELGVVVPEDFGVLATLTQTDTNTFVEQKWLEFPETILDLSGRVFGGNYELKLVVLKGHHLLEQHSVDFSLHNKQNWRMHLTAVGM